MTICNSSNRDVNFPLSFDWISHKTHAFRPRDMTDDAKFMTANMFLAMDKAFQHLLRKCTTSWIVALTFGADTVHLNLYDAEAVDNPKTTLISSAIDPKQAILVEVSRDPVSKTMIVRPLDPYRAKRAPHVGAFLYSTRCLRPAEQQMLTNMQRSVEAGEPVSTIAVEPEPVS